MVSVNDIVLEKEIAPGVSLIMGTYWESSYQDDGEKGFATVSIELLVEGAADFIDDKYSEIFYEEVEEWRGGTFSQEDVIKKFGRKFNELVAAERRKLGKTVAPGQQKAQPKGRGKGWHEEPARHSEASKKGKQSPIAEYRKSLKK